MPNASSAVVRKTLWNWVFSDNQWHQALLLIAAVAAVGANLLPLEMQKRIVNEAIDQQKRDLLIGYCGIYLAAVFASSVLKYFINTLQNVIGENSVYAMRDQLYRHILTLPLRFYRRTQPGLVVSALTTELATAGKFVGMAVAIPATNLLMLAGFGVYLFWLNPLLAALSFSIYPAALLLVPLLQGRVNDYNERRVDTTRSMSGKASESIAGLHEIHANNTYALEGDKFERIIQRLRRIRILWVLYRYAVKRINSLFTNFSRFLVFFIGGYLAIRGQLQLGALVAFLSAQDKLYDPWKELIAFYQAYQTARVTYKQTMSYFDMQADHPLVPEGREAKRLGGDIKVEDVDCVTDDGVQLLSEINLELKSGEHLAIVGHSGSGKSTLVQCIGQLTPYTKGRIRLGGELVSDLYKADMANSIGFVSQAPFIFDGTVEDNLLYAIPPSAQQRDKGLDDASTKIDGQIMMLQQTGLFADVLHFGLASALNPESDTKLGDAVIGLRKTFWKKHRDDLAALVEYYEPDHHVHDAGEDGDASCDLSEYIYSRSILSNIIFGKVRDDTPATRRRINTVITQLLVEADLLEDIVQLGLKYRVGRKGANLSGGQRQKLAIARVLILDEATSGLDNESQERIQRLLYTQWRGTHTLLAVVHRLDTLRYYDKIAVMKGGTVVELGRHEELMDREGILYDLVNRPVRGGKRTVT